MLDPLLPLGLALLAQLAGAPAPAEAAEVSKLEQLAQETLQIVERMRDVKLGHPLKVDVRTKPQITAFIQERLQEEYGPEKVKAEGDLLHLQGLLPQDLDYGALITRLLTEQVAGFYDHTRQTLHIADWIPTFTQAPVMAHEIFHAIQDQVWGGGALIDSKKYSHDEVLAHAALMEGDATIVMLNFAQGVRSPTETQKDASLSPMMLKVVAAALPAQMASPEYPVAASAPEYIKQSLIFPYQQGLLFVGALRQAGWSWAKIRGVYADPPSSSEQILHPERYIERDHPSKVDLSGAFKGQPRGWEGVLGEFHLRQVLLQKFDQQRAAEHAEGWDGDYTILVQQEGAPLALTVSVWDSEAQAQRYQGSLDALNAARTDGAICLSQREAARLDFACARSKTAAQRGLAEAAHARIERR